MQKFCNIYKIMEGMWLAIPWGGNKKAKRCSYEEENALCIPTNNFHLPALWSLRSVTEWDCTFSQCFTLFSEPSHSLSHLEFTGRNCCSRYRGRAGFNSSTFQLELRIESQRCGVVFWGFFLGFFAVILLVCGKTKAWSCGEHVPVHTLFHRGSSNCLH